MATLCHLLPLLLTKQGGIRAEDPWDRRKEKKRGNKREKEERRKKKKWKELCSIGVSAESFQGKLLEFFLFEVIFL